MRIGVVRALGAGILKKCISWAKKAMRENSFPYHDDQE